MALCELVIMEHRGFSVQVNTFVPKCHFLNKVERFLRDFFVEGSILSSACLFMISLRCWFAQVLEYLNSACLYNLSVRIDRMLCSSYVVVLVVCLAKNILLNEINLIKQKLFLSARMLSAYKIQR